MFHKFPANSQRRQMWIQAIKREKPGKPFQLWKPGKNTVICSEHFFGGKKNDCEDSPSYVPSIFPTHHVRPKCEADAARYNRRAKRRETRQTNDDNSFEKEFDVAREDSSEREEAFALKNRQLYLQQKQRQELQEQEQQEQQQQEQQEQEQQEQFCTSNIQGLDSLNDCTSTPSKLRIFLECGVQANLKGGKSDSGLTFEVSCMSNTEKSTQITSATIKEKQQVPNMNKVTQTYTGNPAALPVSMFSDKQFSAFFGVSRSIAQFIMLRTKLKDGRVIRREEKLYLLLAKFKMHVSFSVLASFFGISESLAQSVFRETLDAVQEGVKGCVMWFDKETIKSRMPKAFKACYPDTTIIIDCSEIETEQPPQLRQKVLMYSSYKTRHTYKFLIGIAPSGEVMFISKGYGGRSTDTEITVDSSFLENIEVGDVVMSDKGFPRIEASLNEKGGVLVMPPFKRGNKQFSSQENHDGYMCASVRIHVERAIRRLKVFKIMKFIPQKMICYMDKILVVIAAITNLLPDLIAEDDSEEMIADLTQSMSI